MGKIKSSSNSVAVLYGSDLPSLRHYQTNENCSEKLRNPQISGCKLASLGQSGRAALLEYISAVEVTVLVEMIVNGGVSGSKFLQGLDISEPGHRALSSPERLV